MGNFMPKLNAAGTAWQSNDWEKYVGVLSPEETQAARWGAGVQKPTFLLKPACGAIKSSASVQTGTEQIVTGSPVRYTGGRLTLVHLGGNGAIAGFKAMVAASDDIGNQDFTDISILAFTKCAAPRRAGVEYPNRVTDGSPGWKDITWAGASSVGLADPGVGKIATVTSDVFEELGVLDVANAIYPALIRLQYGSASISYANLEAGANTGTNWLTDVGGIPCISLHRSGDSITTPNSWTSANTPSAPGSLPYVVLELFTETGVTTVLTVGDSRFGVSSETAGKGYLCTEIYLRKALAAAGCQASVLRGGISGAGVLKSNVDQASNANYYLDGSPLQLLGRGPTWLSYLLYTINDGALTDALLTGLLGHAAQIAALARTQGQKVQFLICFPRDSGFSAPEFVRINTLRSFAYACGDSVIDPLALYGAANGTWANFRFDTSHMTNAGYQDLASKMSAAMLG